MPRIPGVYSSVFCPPKRETKKERTILTSDGAAGPFRFVAVAICLLLFFVVHSSVTAIYGQGTTATLSGIVTDPNDAAVPGVNIAVISIAQEFQRSTTTNPEGTFVVPV